MSVELQDSVLLVVSKDPNNQHFGTAFAFHRVEAWTYFLTCRHVVTDVGGSNQAKIHNKLAKVVASGSEEGLDDLAVLQVEGLPDLPTARLAVSGEVGSSIEAAGFQNFAEGYMIRPLRGKLGERVGLESRKQPKRIRAWDINIEGDYSLQRGYSGAPVVEEQSRNVIAVASYRLGDKKGVAISIEALEEIWPNMRGEYYDAPLPSRSTKPEISIGERHRLQQRRSEKNEQFDRLSKIISTLQENLAYEDNPLRQMNLDEAIKKRELERDKLDEEIRAIEERLQ